MPNVNIPPYQNTGIKLTNGRMVKLGTLAAVGDFVQFTIPSPSSPHRGYVNLQVTAAAGWTSPVLTLQVSIDEGRSFASWPTQTGGGSGGADFGGQPQALFFASYIVSGLGSAVFQFGLSAVTVIGAAVDVWALCG